MGTMTLKMFDAVAERVFGEEKVGCDTLKRRKEVASYLYSLWTNNGSNLSSLAPLLVDGTVDIISEYVLGIDADSLNQNGRVINQTLDSTIIRIDIDRIHSSELSYEEFVKNYMECNKPVIITGIADNWTATRKWVNEVDGTPNVDYNNNLVQVLHQLLNKIYLVLNYQDPRNHL
jgi:hypothetical protein